MNGSDMQRAKMNDAALANLKVGSVTPIRQVILLCRCTCCSGICAMLPGRANALAA